MKKQAGIWIDHKEAFVVFVDEGHRPEFGIEKHVHFTGHSSGHAGQADDQRDRQLAAHLGTYYDEVIAQVGAADSIFIIGPGEAKGELEKRLASKGMGAKVVGVETADKMTDHQVAARVRQHFEK